MLMSTDNQFCPGIGQDLPEGLHGRVASVSGTGRPARLMPVRQNTLAGVRRDIALQPGCLDAGSRYINFRIQSIYTPCAQVIGVKSRDIVEVLEIPCCSRSDILMIARYRIGPRFMASPGWVITIQVLIISTAGIDVVTGNKNCTWNGIQ